MERNCCCVPMRCKCSYFSIRQCVDCLCVWTVGLYFSIALLADPQQIPESSRLEPLQEQGEKALRFTKDSLLGDGTLCLSA